MVPMIAKTDAELYQILGDHIVSRDIGSQPPSKREKEVAGKRLYADLTERFKSAICSHPLTQKLLYEKDADFALALGIVMVVVVQVGIFARGVDEMINEIAAFSTILIRQGISAYCS